MENLIVFGTALGLIVAMPFLITWMTAGAKRKKQNRAFGAGLEGPFDVFDPARARAQEVIQIHTEIGQWDQGEAGDPIHPRACKPVPEGGGKVL